MSSWHLECSLCGTTEPATGLPTVCPTCQRPWLVRYPTRQYPLTDQQAAVAGRGMWRFRSFLPIEPGEEPVSLGEGDTPLLPIPTWGDPIGISRLLVKDEGTNPTGSFKSRGLAAAVTRAVAAGAPSFTLPTAGNAGVAAAAYGARAGVPVRVYAPATTPAVILDQIRRFGARLELLDGHIGDCGKASRAYAAESGAFDLSTLREPYRIEGKKTLGLELAEQLDWTLPDVIIYPTGGGTGLIGMWKVFGELRDAGWLTGPMPRMFTVQAEGCAPVVTAFHDGADQCQPWPNPTTSASGLRVPGPLGDRLMLAALRESGGGGVAVSEAELTAAAAGATARTGVDFSPEGGAALAAAEHLRRAGVIGDLDRVVVFNTGAGWLYR
ncbi:MAG: threonine synthase [Gemmatimonadales bacterium]